LHLTGASAPVSGEIGAQCNRVKGTRSADAEEAIIMIAAADAKASFNERGAMTSLRCRMSCAQR
jgi:hypothetical protein